MRIYANIYLIAFGLLIVAMFVLPLFSFEGYSIIKNTVSELGAQKAPGNWLANMSIILVSFAVVLLGTKQLKHFWKQLAALYFFSICFFFTGVYKLAGLDAHTYIFNYTDDALHSLFLMLTGFAFCLFCLFFIFIVKKKKHKWQTAAVIVFAIIVPFLIFKHPEYRGIYQRLLFLGTFGWLFFAFATYPLKEPVSLKIPVKPTKK